MSHPHLANEGGATHSPGPKRALVTCPFCINSFFVQVSASVSVTVVVEDINWTQAKADQQVKKRLEEHNQPNSISSAQRDIICWLVPKVGWQLPKDLEKLSYEEGYELVGRLYARCRELGIDTKY